MASNSGFGGTTLEVSGTSMLAWAIASDRMSALGTSMGTGAGADGAGSDGAGSDSKGQGSGSAICPGEESWAMGPTAVSRSEEGRID